MQPAGLNLDWQLFQMEGDKLIFQGIRAQGTFQIIGWTTLEAEPKENKHMKDT
jgi:hypothetical protein